MLIVIFQQVNIRRYMSTPTMTLRIWTSPLVTWWTSLKPPIQAGGKGEWEPERDGSLPHMYRRSQVRNCSPTYFIQLHFSLLKALSGYRYLEAMILSNITRFRISELDLSLVLKQKLKETDSS